MPAAKIMSTGWFYSLVFLLGAGLAGLATGLACRLAGAAADLGVVGLAALLGGILLLPLAWYCREYHRRLVRQAEAAREQQAQAALRQQVEEFFDVFQAIDGGVYVADMETHEILAITGRDRGCFDSSLVGGKCYEGPGGKQPGPCLFCTNRILLDQAGKPGPAVIREFRNPWNDAWYLGIGRAVPWFDGRLVRMEIAINITQRKKAEEALRQSEQNFRELVENSLVGILLLQDGEIVYQNPEQQRILGRLPRSFKLEEFIGVHPDDLVKVRESYRKIVGGHSSQVDLDFRFYTGGRQDAAALVWVYCRARPIDFQGRKTILISMMDISRAKELERLVGIQDKMSSLGRVAAGIAHEIRNPLSGINIYLATLQKIYDRPEQRDQATEIFRRLATASAKIEGVIRRVMDFSKPGQLQMAALDINGPVLAALELAGVFLSRHGVMVERELAPDLPRCRIDRSRIEQVVLNLLTNSAEALNVLPLARPRRLRVQTAVGEAGVEVRVEDNGPGLPPGVREKIFDPFFTTKSEGTGIGLNISHRIISDHGGRLEADQGSWGGALFRITLPAIAPDPAPTVPKPMTLTEPRLRRQKRMT